MIPRFVYLAIFLSGFASLGYELCWIRKGALLIGATPQALSIVVAVFFGGMAAGAYLFGHFSKRTADPLLWYGIFECVIGLLAATTPALFGLAGETSALSSHWAGGSQTLHLLVRSLLVAVLVFPASMLIGGTLPLLCQFSINNRGADIRFAAGLLYAVNTIGAFFGCMLCGVWLIPYWGTDAAIWFNASLNFAVGAGVIRFSRAVTAPASPQASPPVQIFSHMQKQPKEGRFTRFTFYGLFFLAGFTALGYELLWVRFLSLIINNTVYTMTFSLGAVLLGIAIGGLLVGGLKDRPKQDAIFFAGTNIFIGGTVLLILLQPVASWDWIRGSQSLAMQALLCFIITLIPSVASGVSFPLAYRLIAASSVTSGCDFGRLTAVNTLGGIAGSLLTGFYLLPATGMYSTLLLLTLLSLTIGICTILFFAQESSLNLRALISCGVMSLWLGMVFSNGTNLPADFLAGKRKMIEFAEGMTSFIAVVQQDGTKRLEIDRMWQGQNDKGHQILAAHIPMILHEAPKKVLAIGMGTGQTASRFLMYDIDRLDCVDIEKTLPGILQRHFDAAWLSSPRTHLVTDDGRNFMSQTSERYDVVSIEAGQSFRPQIASFYTVDFYRDVKKRLTKKGLACQFVPVGFFSEAEFRSVLRSFLEVFPQSTLWFNKYAEFILIGNAAEQPLLSARRLGMLQDDATLRSDLNYSFNGRPWLLMNKKEVFAANYLMGPQTLSRLSAHSQLYRDDRPILEYKTARTAYARSRFHKLIENNLSTPDTIFDHKIPIAMEARIIRIREENVHEMLVNEK